MCISDVYVCVGGLCVCISGACGRAVRAYLVCGGAVCTSAVSVCVKGAVCVCEGAVCVCVCVCVCVFVCVCVCVCEGCVYIKCVYVQNKQLIRSTVSSHFLLTNCV